METFPEVTDVLEAIKDNQIDIGAASRTTYPEGANSLLKLYGWDKYFRQKEIYPGSKVAHFKNFAKSTGYGFDEILFFDDEHRNIRDIAPLGVTAILVDHDVGVNMKILEEGIKQFIANQERTKL
jgi:magnesium-dependent phosphatase 1